MVTTMFERRFSLPKGSFFLLGPRGTGKSTLIREHLPKAYLVDLLDEARFQTYLVEPSRLGEELRTRKRGSWVAIDEVQRLPALLNEVHRAIEGLGLQFALTGSSARKLRRGGTNLLGGRAQQLAMYPFVPEELGKQFELERALSYGTLPLIVGARDRKATLEAYVRTYLKEEIQAEALVRNLGSFARFLPVAGLMHGQTLNTSSIARDAGVARTTVEGFVEVLEDTLLATRLRAFEGRLRVRERKHPKFYLFDPGVTRAVKGQLGPLTAEERGPLLEGLVFMMLRFYAERSRLWDEIAYWAPGEASTTEVDFVLLRGKEVIAVEVKATKSVRPQDLRGLRAISELPGLKQRLLVFTGTFPQRTEDGIDVLPFSNFAEQLALGRI